MKIKERPEYNAKAKPVTLSETAMVREAITLMSERKFGSIIIARDDQTIAGIVTERDLMIRLLHEKKDPDKTPLSEIMTKDLRVARGDDDVMDWLRIMSNERFRHLPIVDEDEKLINVMSLGDFVSYTWPEMMTQIKAKTKESFAAGYQIVLIIAALLIYALIVNLAG